MATSGLTDSGSTPSQPPSSAVTGASDRQPPAILAHGISMVYGSKTQPFQALRGVDLEVPRGAVQLVMGPAGAGKTTLLLNLGGLLTPTAGQIELLGTNITALSRCDLAQFRLKHIGFAFQENNLLRSLSALENVELALEIKGIRGERARQQAQSLLEAVHLGDKALMPPRLLSGGQQQRVAVARALAGTPPLIIADEPTSALDSANGQLIGQLLRQLAKQQGCTLLIATHDPRLIAYADRIAYLEDGVIIRTEGLS